MASVRCFFLEPTEFAEESLRRYSPLPCVRPGTYHNAAAKIGVVPYPHSDFDGESDQSFPQDDPRWPERCVDCDYRFIAADRWQHNKLRLYARGDHLAMMTTLSDAPVGAMWYADWYDWKGPDGHCLIVKTPAGDWIVDAPSWSGGEQTGKPWTRTGSPPFVTASPSIHFPGKFHGWLRDGILTDV